MTPNFKQFTKFNYDGGSNPGAERHVYIIEALDTSSVFVDLVVRAFDFDRGGFRSFNVGKMSNVKEIPNCYSVEIPSETTDQIKDAFDFTGYNTQVLTNGDHPEIQTVLAYMPEPESRYHVKINTVSNCVNILFTHPNGETLQVGFIPPPPNSRKVMLLVDGYEYEVPDLAEALTRFVGSA